MSEPKKEEINTKKGMIDEVIHDPFFLLIVKVVGLVTSFVLGMYFLHFMVAPIGWFSNDPTHWGAFGDFLAGVLNPIVATLTLVLVAATVFYTKRMLDATRNEMQSTQDEMARQNFDSRAAFLLQTFNNVRDGLIYAPLYIGPMSGREHYGVEALFVFFKDDIVALKESDHKDTKEDELREIIQHFTQSFDQRNPIKSYFSCLNKVVFLIKREELFGTMLADSAMVFSAILGSMISDDEAAVLFLYGMSSYVTDQEQEALFQFLESDVIPTLTGNVAITLTNLLLMLRDEQA